MAIALDASTPAQVILSKAAGTGSAITGATASITPPNTSMLIACVAADSSGTTETLTLTMSSTISGLGAWTKVRERQPAEASQGGYAGIAWALLTTSASGTVTASLANHGISTAGNRGYLKLYVLTGQNTTTPNGTSNEGNSTTNNLTTGSVTTSAANSWVFGCGSEWQALGSPTSSDLTFDAFHIASVMSGGSGYKNVASSGASATANLDASGASGANWNWVLFEVIEQAGGGGGGQPTAKRMGGVMGMSHGGYQYGSGRMVWKREAGLYLPERIVHPEVRLVV
jgi:hypothetical protein